MTTRQNGISAKLRLRARSKFRESHSVAFLIAEKKLIVGDDVELFQLKVRRRLVLLLFIVCSQRGSGSGIQVGWETHLEIILPCYWVCAQRGLKW